MSINIYFKHSLIHWGRNIKTKLGQYQRIYISIPRLLICLTKMWHSWHFRLVSKNQSRLTLNNKMRIIIYCKSTFTYWRRNIRNKFWQYQRIYISNHKVRIEVSVNVTLNLTVKFKYFSVADEYNQGTWQRARHRHDWYYQRLIYIKIWWKMCRISQKQNFLNEPFILNLAISIE